MALAVSHAENGTRVCDRKSPVNKNGTYDIGLFQINTVHWKRFGLETLMTCEGNTNAAHVLWYEQGPAIWSTVKLKRHLKSLAMYEQKYRDAYPKDLAIK